MRVFADGDRELVHVPSRDETIGGTLNLIWLFRHDVRHTDLERQVHDGIHEGCGRAGRRVHELVEGVDALHVPHDTEGEICDDVGVALHIVDDRLVEVPNLVLAALLTVVLVSGVVVLISSVTISVTFTRRNA